MNRVEEIVGFIDPTGRKPTWFYCSKCQTRHARIVQARPMQPETWGTVIRRNWPEAVGGVFVLLLCWGVLAYIVPLLAEAAR